MSSQSWFRSTNCSYKDHNTHWPSGITLLGPAASGKVWRIPMSSEGQLKCVYVQKMDSHVILSPSPLKLVLPVTHHAQSQTLPNIWSNETFNCACYVRSTHRLQGDALGSMKLKRSQAAKQRRLFTAASGPAMSRHTLWLEATRSATAKMLTECISGTETWWENL